MQSQGKYNVCFAILMQRRKIMTEREKKALDAITKAIPTLDEFSKGFLSGYLAAKDETTEKKTDKKTEDTEETKND